MSLSLNGLHRPIKSNIFCGIHSLYISLSVPVACRFQLFIPNFSNSYLYVLSLFVHGAAVSVSIVQGALLFFPWFNYFMLLLQLFVVFNDHIIIV